MKELQKDRNDRVARVLLFHDIVESSRAGFQKSGSRYLTSLTDFIEAVNISRDEGLKFERLMGEKGEEDESIVRVTIDDGGGSSVKSAESLASIDVKAYFFIPTQFIDSPGFLSSSEIKRICEMGHSIGSHSHTHPNPFCNLEKKQIFSEVLKSRDLLSQLISCDISVFSIPGGEIRSETLTILSDKELGLSEIYTSLPKQGLLREINGVKIFGRLCIESKMKSSELVSFMQGENWLPNRVNYQTRRFFRELKYIISNNG